MMNLRDLLKWLVVCLSLIPAVFSSQNTFQFNITTEAEACVKGSATLDIAGTNETDSLLVQWSSGEKNKGKLKSATAKDLEMGEQSVSIKVKYKKDTLILVKDTTLYFRVAKELCAIAVSKYFTPNGDGRNDLLDINNIDKHPSFDLKIFNKWGQQIHQQSGTYTPWDGTWLGTNLPEGVYYYVFFYNSSNKKVLEKGDITLIR